MPAIQRSRLEALRCKYSYTCGCDRIRKRSSAIASITMRATSAGYVRGNLKSLAVVRGGAQPKMLSEEDRDHDDEVEDDYAQVDDVTEALSEIRAGVLEAAEGRSANPVASAMAELETRIVQPARHEAYAKRAAEARMKGYEGDACGSCGNFTLVRNGTCLKCNTCGSTSGCS